MDYPSHSQKADGTRRRVHGASKAKQNRKRSKKRSGRLVQVRGASKTKRDHKRKTHPRKAIQRKRRNVRKCRPIKRLWMQRCRDVLRDEFMKLAAKAIFGLFGIAAGFLLASAKPTPAPAAASTQARHQTVPQPCPPLPTATWRSVSNKPHQTPPQSCPRCGESLGAPDESASQRADARTSGISPSFPPPQPAADDLLTH